MPSRTTHHDDSAELSVAAETSADSTLTPAEVEMLLEENVSRWATLLDRLK